MTGYEAYCVEREAIDKYGSHSQIVVAIEELSELIKELTKYLRCEENVNHISEEMADVGIMLDQLIIMFNNANEIEIWRSRKLERLAERLHNNTDSKE